MANQSDGNSFKADLLGATAPVQATGGHTPDPARLQAPLEGPGSVISMFCTGCVRIPAISATDSGLNRPPVPVHFGHRFRTKTATPSGGLRGLTISSS